MSSPVLPFLCIRCGARRVTLRQGPGRTYAYRVFPSLTVPENVGIPTCGRCYAVYIDAQTAAMLEPVLAAEYKRQLSRKGQQALADLSPRISQRALEKLLDISQGYLSRIYRGHGDPSPQLAVLLALLAQDPALLEWVSRYWAEPSPQGTRPEPLTKSS